MTDVHCAEYCQQRCDIHQDEFIVSDISTESTDSVLRFVSPFDEIVFTVSDIEYQSFHCCILGHWTEPELVDNGFELIPLKLRFA